MERQLTCHRLRQLAERLPPRQQTLDFARSERWHQLPHSDQQACRQAMAKLLYQVVAQAKENEDE